MNRQRKSLLPKRRQGCLKIWREKKQRKKKINLEKPSLRKIKNGSKMKEEINENEYAPENDLLLFELICCSIMI